MKGRRLQPVGSVLVAVAIVAVVILVVTARLSSIPADQLERQGDRHGGDHHGHGGG